MIFVTGDKHRRYRDIEYFCEQHNTTRSDIMIVLGDNGLNFRGAKYDSDIKALVSSLPITFFMIRGNHDMRPPLEIYKKTNISTKNFKGTVLVERAYPNLWFAIDGEIYEINGEKAIVIGGAYSVDKPQRLQEMARGNRLFAWFPDEQLTESEMALIFETILKEQPDVILSHTCPLRHVPVDAFLPYVDQNTVDETMERWFDKVEDVFGGRKWYCGHWHVDKEDGIIRFLYKDIIAYSYGSKAYSGL